MVGAYGNEIVCLGMLELQMGNISLELEPDSEPFPELLRTLLVIVPPVVIRLPWLTYQLLGYLFSSIRVPPNHYLDGLSMAEPDNVVSGEEYLL